MVRTETIEECSRFIERRCSGMASVLGVCYQNLLESGRIRPDVIPDPGQADPCARDKP